MNNTDKEYNRLLNLVLEKGKIKKNRTGVDTIGTFGAQARFNLEEGFPLLTTKKIYFRSIVHELLWFLSGSTNIKYLIDNDVHIWDDNCYDKFKRINKDNTYLNHHTKETFINWIKCDKYAAKSWGDLGEGTYGGMWRAFPYFHEDKDEIDPENPHFPMDIIGSVDQIQKVIDKLKTNPDDRRLIVSAWHPYWVDHCALPPCHCLFQFHTEELTESERVYEYGQRVNNLAHSTGKFIPALVKEGATKEIRDNMPKRRLNCQLYQRSCDLFLGIPFNIASYALLTAMMAQVSNMVPGEFIHTYGDLHLYSNHLDKVKEQLSREPKQLPKLVLNPEVKSLFDFKFDDIKIEGYDPHPAIKAGMAV